MLWESYKSEFSKAKARPSYSSNIEINNDKIIRLYKQYKFLYRCKRSAISAINKIFLGLEFLTFPLSRKYIYKYGLYLQENSFLKLCLSSPEILKIHKDLNWNISFTTVKAAYYYSYFTTLGVDFNHKKVVEIGPGGGHLASIILYYHSNVEYTCVDLPEMKQYAFFEMTLLGHMKKLIYGRDFNSNKFLYIHPQEFYEAKHPIDILLNIESFGEMSSEIAFDYTQYCLSLMNSEGYFISVNRMNRVINPNKPEDALSYNGYLHYKPRGMNVVIEEPDRFKLNDEHYQIDFDKMNLISVLRKG